MIHAALLALIASQAPVSQFDEGSVVGRVCDDLDGDNRCGVEEPGVVGVHVLLETGLEAVTDREGRFHLTALSARTPDGFGGGRLVQGRHRIKIDERTLIGAWTGADRGVTFELPAGGAVLVELPIRRASLPPVSLSTELPALRKPAATLEYELALTVAEGETLHINGVRAVDGRAWVPLAEGTNEFIIAAVRPGATRLWTHRVELVRRDGSSLVVPTQLEAIGSLTWSAGAPLSLELIGVTARIGDQAVGLDETGRAVRELAGESVVIELTRGTRVTRVEVTRAGASGLTFVGLLDLQANVDITSGAFSVFGRGAGAARASFAGFKLGAEIDFREVDWSGLYAGSAVQARRVDVFERQLDPMRYQTAWADDSATVASNPSEGRLRVELSRDGWGKVGFGSARWFQAKADVGRSHRALQGAFIELKTPTDDSPFGVELRGVAAPGQSDALNNLVRRQMHERFESTGGSLFFLANSPVVQGSETIRVEWRDAVTQLPVRDVHLQRLRDYTLDPFSGRVLLARPLSFYVGDSLLQSDPLTAGITAVLVVDYEYVDDGLCGDAMVAGELRGRLGPVSLTGSALRDGSYGLYRGAAEAKLGPVLLSAEAAYSQGAVQGLGYSRDGGLTRELANTGDSSGLGVTVRARSKGLFGKGSWDAAWRWRQAGFQDIAQLGALNQVSLRGEQPLGPVIVAVLADYRDMPDPRSPFSGLRVTGRTLGGGVGYENPTWGVRLEAREFEQTFTNDGTRGGLTIGLAGRYRITDWLQLRAGYRQQVLSLGGMDLTFGSVGVDVKPTRNVELGLRGGWGPALGPQVWGTLAYSRGNETWYGVHSIDADAPGTGERRLVTGVRQQVDAATSVFVEDVSAADIDGLRLARAVGMTQKLDDAFTISARYEHGMRALEGFGPEQARNAGGVTAALELENLRVFARGEVRDEQGANPLRQFVATGGGEWRPHRDVSMTARALWTHSMKNDVMVGRSVDATTAIAWRFGSGAVMARYAYKQDWTSAFEQRLHVISLLPTVKFGDRFAIGAGGHLGFTQFGPILSASLRPSVRVWEGLEVAAEVAARSLAPDAGGWASVRGELGYRFDHRFFVGAGYNALGFSGTGLDFAAAAAQGRVYLRTEVSY
ncbi:MAG: hypothetical protein ACO1OB_02180 [Archangium sp.]